MRLDGVAFRYRRRGPWVLRDVSLTLPTGRVIEVTGHNGAGKSTLLRLLAGVVPPSRGRIIGRPDRVGYAPEHFPAAQPFTVGGYLAHMTRVRGLSATDAEDWAGRLRLRELLGTRLTELSKGGAQKVGLVQALIGEPGLIVLDEPFAGLDAETRADLPVMLLEATRNRCTVVVSDHQRELHELPGTDRLCVSGHAVERHEARTDLAVLEVVVSAAEADDVAAKLRADGYDVRTPSPSRPTEAGR